MLSTIFCSPVCTRFPSYESISDYGVHCIVYNAVPRFTGDYAWRREWDPWKNSGKQAANTLQLPKQHHRGDGKATRFHPSFPSRFANRVIAGSFRGYFLYPYRWSLFSIFGWNAHASTFRNGETVRYSVFGNRKAGRAEQPNACIVITLDNQAQWSTRWEGE